MEFDCEKHLEETQRLTHVGTWEWDVAPDKIVWSDELYRIFGVTPETFTPTLRAALSFVHPDDRESVEAIVERAVTEHTAFECQYRVVRPDGEVRCVYALGAWGPPESEAGTRMYGTAQDVTERKQIEDALRHTESRLRDLLEERERIARDLHDRMLQDLYAVALSLEGAQTTVAARPVELQPIVGRTLRTINSAIDTARDLLELSQPAPEVDLEEDLQTIARTAEGIRNVSVVLDVTREALDAVPREARGHVVSIVREAVSNSLRHSGASSIRISLHGRGVGTWLAVEDDGSGFDFDRASRRGRGLHYMASRARALGAKLIVNARPGGGTSVAVETGSAPITTVTTRQ